MSKTLVASALVMLLAVPAAAATPSQGEFPPLPKPGRKVPLGKEHYFTYGFTHQPKLGTAVMRVEVFTQDGKRDTSFAIQGDADMPSMRGAHSSGPKPFALSNKGVYLLPVQHHELPRDVLPLEAPPAAPPPGPGGHAPAGGHQLRAEQPSRRRAPALSRIHQLQGHHLLLREPGR